MTLDKERIAKEYYKGLLDLKTYDNDITKKLYEKAIKTDEDKFVREYPLSTLGIVSYRTFWELLLELKIVNSAFHSDENKYSNDFEIRLKKVIEDLIYNKNTLYTLDDIKAIFKKYQVSA